MIENKQIKVGKIGKLSMILSFGCAVHCVISPFLILFLPFLSQNEVGVHHYFDFSIIFLAGILGYSSLIHSYKGHHQNSSALKIFSIGFMFMVVSSFLQHHFMHLPLIIIGSLVCGVAQFLNFRFSRPNVLTTA